MRTTLTDEKQVSDFTACNESHEPNEETIAAFKESENLDNLTSYENIYDMFRDFGIKC